MATQIFVNLPVKDLGRSIDFFTRLGFHFDPRFTDEKAGCMMVEENIFVMLLAEKFFHSFIKKEICDTGRSAETILAVSAGSREQVDEMINRALAAGGSTPSGPQDDGWMYGRGFQDPDGHLWEVLYMDATALHND
jgi:predicted lactoylglutathione lyase